MKNMNTYEDERKQFIIKISGTYFCESSEECSKAIYENSDINQFLDDSECRFVFLHYTDSKLVTNNRVAREDNIGNALVFYKISPTIITDENISTTLRICSLQNPPLDSFYNVLQNVYIPALFQEGEAVEDIKLRTLFENVEAGIKSAIVQKNLVENTGKEKIPNLNGILNLKDECIYWDCIAHTIPSQREKSKATKILNILRPLESKFTQPQKIQNLEDLIEDVYNTLDDIWKLEDCNFPEERMINLFDIVGNSICHSIQVHLKSKHIWSDSYHEINETLLTCLEICNKWIDTCVQLTTIFWLHYTPRPWTRGAYEPKYIKQVIQRWNEILEIRNLHQTICQILNKAERVELKIEENFMVFDNINVVQYNPYTDHLWQAGLSSFRDCLRPTQQYVGKRVKEKLKDCNNNVLEMIESFKCYRTLIQTLEIREMLKTERQNFLVLLQDYLNDLSSNDFHSSDATIKKFPTNFPDLPDVILKIIRVKEMCTKIKNIENNILPLLDDLNNFEKLKESVAFFRKELQTADGGLFNEWSSRTIRALSSSELSLKTEDPVVYFEQNKLMTVNYSPKLVQLIKEVHSLQLLGYNIPSAIVQLSDKAKVFLRQAKALEQVSNFHNTIGDRMIPSQRPIMLASAMELSKLVKQENSVTWSDSVAVDRYISRLQLVVDQLGSENNRLYFYHSQIVKKVALLFDTDLVQQKNIWKDILREIRDIIGEVISMFSNTKTWLIHWDHQIYKALLYQYQVGLLNLNQHLPEIKIEIGYRQQKLQFNPPMEEIKTQYYNQLKQFIMLPLAFQGVLDASESIFSVMVIRNADYFQQVYINAERTFQKLESLKDEWIDKIALGAVDLENVVRDHLKTAEDWDVNFKASKAWGQEIAKIIDCEHKIECFTVSSAPVRSEIELHNNRYWDTLSISLYASIMVDANIVEDFITTAKKRLEYQPQTYDEIGEASEAYHHVIKEGEKIVNIVEEMHKKNKVLSSWTKENVSQVADIKFAWNNFRTLLDNQQYYINRQVESIKSKLTTDADNLFSEVEKFVLRWNRVRPKETDLVDGNYSVINNNLVTLKEKREEWDKLFENVTKIRRDYERFGVDAPEFSQYQELEDDLKECEEIWGLYEKFSEGLNEFSSEEWTIFRSRGINKFETFLTEWEDKLEHMTVTPLTARLMSDIHKYKHFIPQIKFLRGDAFSNKHWSELCTILTLKPKLVENLTLDDFLQVQDTVMSNLEAIKELNNRAASEAIVRQALAELDIWEVESKFSFMPHKPYTGDQIHLIKDFKVIRSKIGDNQCLLQMMVGSTNYDQYQDLTSMWESKLSNLDYYLKHLSDIQRKWLYLEPIFKNETMKIEKTRFERINKDVRHMFETLFSGDQRVVSLNRIPNLRFTIDTLIQQLNICQKSLNEYLEEKRLKFPRFYFLSDDDLLEILGQANKPDIVQSHLKKLFAAINSVTFNENNIIAVQSLEGEIVYLKNPVTISLDVENWLDTLSVEVNETLKQLLSACLKDADPLLYPSQVLCLAESISFTSRCEEAIKMGKLKSLLSTLDDQLKTYTKLDLELEEGEESRGLELKLKALIFDTIYHANIVKDLIKNSVSATDEWNWEKRIRFYLNPSNLVSIKMVDAEFTYSFEYQGNAPKLVHTPLTDRCYLTLTQAMSMGLGGNPYGPAGTGKTESVKALGRLFGRQVLVFNCDEGLDITSLTRILIGLVKCGAWGCFDEFNRLEEATLSAVSTQIHTIQEALRSGNKNITLMNRQITLNTNTGIFVTMNPVDRAYGGRQKLPDNLKQLFRPVAMSQPDNLQIAEVILYSEGFKNAKLIARKLVQIFDIAKQILSQQKHYDWGLRALKTVVGGCKTALKVCKSSASAGTIDEVSLVVQALRLNTLSKLTYDDAQQFDALISSTFHNVQFQALEDNDMSRAIEQSFSILGLRYNKRQVKKCLELYEQLEQRMGVVVVGPSGSGKSTLCKLLRQALICQKRSVNQYIINPKSMPRAQLLGQIDQDTRQWIDGVLSLTAQRVYNEAANIESWIIFDGDIDPEWIESLNSVLDDNRLLTLPSGWRIHFGATVHFLFETHSLQYASPATVSRMGIILLSDEDVDVRCVVESWLYQQPEEQRIILADFIEKYFYKGVEWVQSKAEMTTRISICTLLRNCLSLMRDVKNKTKFCVLMMNGFAATMTVASKESFCRQVLEWCDEFIPDTSKILSCYYNELKSSIDCHTTDHESNSTIVKTGQVETCIDILEVWLGEQKPVILIGPQGCGKNQILQCCIQEMKGTEIVTIFGSSQLTPTHVLQKLSQVCMSITGNNGVVFRPKSFCQLIVHIKDLNLTFTDKWGTNTLVAFLQQVLTYNGFYDPFQMEWVMLERIQFVCSLLSCEDLSPRFISCNHLICLWPPDQSDLQTFCSSYLKPLVVSDKLKSIIWSIMTTVYLKIKDMFYRGPHQDNEFNLRNLCSWCTGLRRYSVKTDQEIMQALLYEGNRLFLDRLVGENDKNKFAGLVKTIIEAELGQTSAIDQSKSSLVFTCDNGTAEGLEGPLNQISLDDWRMQLEKYINLLENEGELIDRKVLLPEVAKMVAYFERVLTLPGGALLLPGHSGFGRKSAVRLVAVKQSARLFSPKVSSAYGIHNFKNDMKTILHQAGLENQVIYFILEDYQIVNETMLDYLNGLLASGEIPGLYQTEEFETLCAPLKEVINQYDFQGTPSQFFTERVKRNVHIIIIADFAFNDTSCRWITNPIVRRRCQTIWLSEWSIETKQAVLQSVLKENNEGSENNEEASDDHTLFKYFLEINEDAKTWMTVTPRHFMLFAKTYMQIKQEKEKSILDSEGKLKAGLSKLTEAKTVVAQLKEDAAQQESKLAEKQSKANAALELITKTMQNASSQKTEMEFLKENIEKENNALSIRKTQIDAELAQVEPILAEARSAVGNIKSEALSEIRSLRAPPDIIHDILEGVLRVMGIQDTSWNSMKTFLAKRGVKEDIRCFDARSIFVENRLMVEELLRKRERSFDEKNAKRASTAAAPLAAWVIANVKYSQILDKIRPLETEQNKLQLKLKQSENEILLLSSGLDDVEQNVQQLKEQLNINTKEAAEIEIHLTKVQDTISAAEGLVIKLDDEYSRWSELVMELSKDLTVLTHNCLLSSAIIVYLSHSSEDIRRSMLDKWQKMLAVEDFKLERFLSSEQEQLKWLSEELPSDYLSIQNAIIISQLSKMEINASLTPFLIDPSDIALSWLENLLKKKKTVDTIALHSPRIYTSLELAIRFGKALIIRDVTIIDPILVPILRRNFVFQGTRKLIPVGDKLVDCHPEFQLYMISRSVEANMQPYFSSLFNSINFEITYSRFSQQLLRCALSVENPDLERRRVELLKKEDGLKMKLFALQDNILIELANAQGNVLENKELLATLNETKKHSQEIKVSLTESQEIKAELSQEYEVYKPLAEKAATLYFSILSLKSINHFYQISMDSFINIYKSIFSSQQLQREREFDVEQILKDFIYLVYKYICRFLFKQDIVTFSLHLIHNMYPQFFQHNEWELFKREILVDALADSPEVMDSVPSWASTEQAFDIYLLKISLPSLYNQLNTDDEKLWEVFVTSDSSDLKKELNLTPFQRVLVVQAFKPGYLHSALVNFVQQVLGLRNMTTGSLPLDKLLIDTTAKEPILIIISLGVDPSEELRLLVRKRTGLIHHEIALGQGQTTFAEEFLHECAKNGSWLTLKNLHLMISWLPILEQEIRSLNNVHEDFRLWLTAEPHADFPSTLLQSCLKITYETPQGLKSNLDRTFNKLPYEKQYAKSVFTLSWFHAVIQERKTYIPQGWCKFYEFNDSDLFTAFNVIKKRLSSDNKNVIKWDYIHGIFEQAIYGGRIDNLQDLKILTSYLHSYFNDDVINAGRKALAPHFHVPQSSELKEYLTAIQNLPESNSPQFFNLPLNVHLSWQKKRSLDVIGWLKVLKRQNVITSKSNVEEWKSKISPILHLWKQLNQEIGIIKMKKISTEHKETDPVKKFLIREFDFALNLVNHIHKTLVDINRITRTASFIDKISLPLTLNVVNHRTPDSWLVIWEGSLDLIVYIKSVMNRASAIIELRKYNDTIGQFITKEIDLKHFFNPQTFLSIFKQYSSELNGVPLDNLQLECSWKNHIANSKVAITIEGLLMEGASIDSTGVLLENLATSSVLVRVPNLKLAWVSQDFINVKRDNVLQLPVYHNSNRDNVLMFIRISIIMSDYDKWTQMNPAIYLQ